MPKWRDKRTGQVFEGDEFGNPLTEPSSKNDPFFKPDPSKESVIRPMEITDYLRHYGGRFVPSALTAIGGIIGGAAGTPFGHPVLGSAVGAGAGSIVGREFQEAAPSVFGEYTPKDAGERLKDVGIDVGADIIGSGIGHVAKYLFPSQIKSSVQRQIPKIFEPTIERQYLQALTPDPNPRLDLSLGQVNETAGKIEDFLLRPEKRKIIEGQRDVINKWFRGKQYGQENIIQTAQANAALQKEKARGVIRQAYQNFEPFKAQNTVDVQVPQAVRSVGFKGGSPQFVMRPEKITGAIPLQQSSSFVEPMIAQLEKEMGPDLINEANLGKGLGNPMVRVLTELKKIGGVRTRIDPATGQHFKNPIASFDQLRDIKVAINDYLFKESDPVLRSRLQGTLRALATTIDNDIDAGVKAWGPQAYKNYRHAQDTYASMSKKVDNKLATRLLNETNDPEITYQQIARSVLNDPKRSQQFIDITNDRASLQQLFLDDMAEKSFDNVTGHFEPDKALEYIQNKRAVAGKAVSPTTLANVERFLRRSQLAKPLGSGSTALNLTRVRGTLGMAVGAASFAKGEDWKDAATYGGLAAFSPSVARQLYKRILMNPESARIATGLLNAPPASPTAQRGAKTLLGLIKGAQVMIMTPDGPAPFTVNNDGKLERSSVQNVQDVQDVPEDETPTEP